MRLVAYGLDCPRLFERDAAGVRTGLRSGVVPGVSRRRLLSLGGALLATGVTSGLLAACGAPPVPPTPAPAPAPAPTESTTAASATSTPETAAIQPPTTTVVEPVPAHVAPSTAPAVAPDTGVTRAAFVYSGAINDHGWSNAHDDGRKALEQALGSSVETAYTENVPDGVDAQGVFEDYARKGYDIIYGTSFGFMDAMLEVAKSFPDVKFDHCAGSSVAPNLATYAAALEEPRYVSGMIAGKMTRTSTLGFLGSFPIPEGMRALNAFAAGVQATNPTAKILVVWINAWFDPHEEKAGADALLDLNADVLTGTTDSPSLAQAAGARGKYAVGVDYEQSADLPQTVIQSDRFVWGPHYIDSVRSVINGTWKTAQLYYHMKDGLVEPTRPADFVPADVASAAMSVAAQIKAGTFTIWKGPLVDNQGNVKAPEGKTLGDFFGPGTTVAAGQSRDDAYVQSAQMNWALSNVVGDLPPS